MGSQRYRYYVIPLRVRSTVGSGIRRGRWLMYYLLVFAAAVLAARDLYKVRCFHFQ